jgi:hypothetical protein
MKTVMRCESPIAFDILGSRVPGRRQAPSCLPPHARSWSLSLERPTVDLSSIRQSSGPSKYIDRLALTSSSTSSCATTARTLRRNNHHSTIASPHIHAQPRASSRSRSQAARRAAASRRIIVVVVVANPTSHAASPKVRSLTLPCHYSVIGHSYRAFSRVLEARFVAGSLGIDRLFFTHARTRSRSNLRLACKSRITCIHPSPSVSVHFGVATTRTLQLFARNSV